MSDVNKEIGLYPMSGDVVRFVSTAKLPIGGFETELHPIQDLHGQEYPYPPMGHGNLCRPLSGYINGITFTIEDDGTIHQVGTYITSSWTFITNRVTLESLGLSAGDRVTLYSNIYFVCEWFRAGESTRIGYGASQGTYSYFKIPAEAEEVRMIEYSTATINNIAGTSIDQHAKFLLAKGEVDEWYPYSNICPITGYDSMTIYVSPTPEITDETKVHTIEFPVQGKNLFDVSLLVEQASWHIIELTLSPNTKYTMSSNMTFEKTSELPVYFKTENIGGGSSSLLVYSGHPVTLTSDASGHLYISERRVSGTDVFLNYQFQIEIGESATAYDPYKGHTVYEGTLTINEDGTGQIVSTMASVDLGTLNWNTQSNATQYSYYSAVISGIKAPSIASEVANVLSPMYRITATNNFVTMQGDYVLGVSVTGRVNVNDNRYTTLADFKTAMNGVQLVYELAEPITINLTVEQIETLIGFNYVWNNVGTTNITFQYYTGGEGMDTTFLDCWTYPKAKLDEMFKAVTDRLDALEEASDASEQASVDPNRKTTLLETNEEATEPVAEVEREGDE